MPFWITLFRGFSAISLGLVLLFLSDKAPPMLVNFMGIFWLLGGIVSLRWSLSGERARDLSLVAGVIGVLAGLIIDQFPGSRPGNFMIDLKRNRAHGVQPIGLPDLHLLGIDWRSGIDRRRTARA